MADDTQELFAEYHDLGSDVIRSGYQFFVLNLRRWFELLDETPPFARIILQQLNATLEFEGWYDRCLQTMGSMVGSGTLDWPDDRRKRLGLQLELFRKFAREEMTPYDFCSHFLYAENDYNAMVASINNQLFAPMAGDLERYLRRALRETPASDLQAELVPASDRVVRLDHNSTAYKEAIDALEQTEDAVKNSNDYPDLEDKEQRVAELSAGRRLLRTVRVRTGAVIAVIGAALGWLAIQFAGHLIGSLADAAWLLIKGLIGL